MTVILQRSGTVIAGPPRTASRWLVQAVTASGVPCWTAPGHQLPAPGTPAVAVSRHPVGWLGAMHRTPTGAGSLIGWPIPHPVPGESLARWVDHVLAEPGCVGRFFRQWHLPGNPVIRFEALVPDLLRVLTEAGEDPDAAAVWALAGWRPGAGAVNPAAWPRDLAAAVCEAEADFIAEFYPPGG